MEQKVKEAFDELLEIAGKDPGDASKRLAKLLEEGGELATSVLKLAGYKSFKPGDTEESLKANIIEESADLFQVIGSIWVLYGITLEDVIAALPEKNKKYGAFVEKLLQAKT
jgi:NTP pyrophosphatase (non-canonical NTP hydrolase)